MMKGGGDADLVTLRKFKHKGKMNLKCMTSCPVFGRIHAAVDGLTEDRQKSENYAEEKLGKDARIR